MSCIFEEMQVMPRAQRMTRRVFSPEGAVCGKAQRYNICRKQLIGVPKDKVVAGRGG